jgi:hypothetical protein
MGKFLLKSELWKAKEMYRRIKIQFRVTGCEDGRWMELTQDRVQLRVLLLAVLNLQVLLRESKVVNRVFWK